MHGPVIYLERGTKLHPRLRGKILVTRHILIEVSYVIPNKSAYMGDENWLKVVKVVASGIGKMKVSYVAFVLPIFFSIYLTLRICTSKFSADDFFPKWWA